MKRIPLSTVLESAKAGYWGREPGTADIDVAVVRNGDIKADGIQWASLPKRGFSRAELDRSRLRRDDVLITTSGDCGQVAMISDQPDANTCATNFVRILRFDPGLVNAKFMYHFLNSPRFKNSLSPYIRGTTLQNLSTRDAFNNVEVPLPSMAEQCRIAAILDRADLIRVKRRQVFAELNTISYSIFRELFDGDAASTTIDKVANQVRTGPFGSQLLHSEFVSDGIAVLGLDNVVSNEFRWVKRRYVTPAKYEQLRRYTVHPGDVLISIMGTIGRCVVVPDDIPTAINTKHICAITADPNQLLPVFLRATFLWHPESRSHLQRQTKGSIMDGLNMSIIKSMPVPVPPLEKQKEYANKIERITEHRAVVSQALAADDELLASLQSLAFRGEL